MKGKRAPLITGAVGLVLALLLIMFMVLPKMHQVSAAKDERVALADQQSQLLSQLAVLKDAQADEAKNRQIIANVVRQLPPTVDEPGLLLLLANAASDATLPLTQFTPGTPILDSTSGLSSIPVTFAVTGTYFSLAQFLFNLETLPRVAKVQTVTVTAAASADTSSSVPSLQMTGSVTLYTTDANAGPGSQPGPTSTNGTVTVLPSLPPPTSPSPSDTGSPSTSASPSSSASPGA
jgi:Tfp pilus assembly protein PilO